jgi:glycosyltransferase involved in cell wall biosynthesis
MKPLVSVLIPMYNAQQWITETLESVLNQTWQKIEIIVVDDGSTDNSYKIVKSFESSLVRVIKQENAGCSAARNLALEESQGELIQYLDADDLLDVNKIELQIQRFKDLGSFDYIVSGEWARFTNSPKEANFVAEPVWCDLSPVDWIVCSWEGGGMMHPAAWLIPRSISNVAGRFDEVRCPDAEGEYITRILLNSKGILFCKNARSFYRSGVLGSLSGTKNLGMMSALYRSLEMSHNHLLVAEDSPRTRKACANNLQRFIYGAYPDYPNLVEQAENVVQSLGGADIRPDGSSIFKAISSLGGWKLARQTQSSYYKMRKYLQN